MVTLAAMPHENPEIAGYLGKIDRVTIESQPVVEFTVTNETCNFREGGHWRFVFHGPDGKDYPNHNIFVLIEPGRRVVIRHEDPTHGFRLTISLQDEGHGTRDLDRVEIRVAALWRHRRKTVDRRPGARPARRRRARPHHQGGR